jgi:hypothetical protein
VITKDISIEELVQTVPDSVGYLMDRGIKCLACGEPLWDTLENAAREKGFSEEEIEGVVDDLWKIHTERTNRSRTGGASRPT